MKKEKKTRITPLAKKLDFNRLIARWGRPLVKRSEVTEFSCGLLSPKTLANLAAKGEGPPCYHVSRYVVYEATELASWLDQKSKPK